MAADVRTGQGHHGRLKERECRSCHTDHRGRDAKIVVLDEKSFEELGEDAKEFVRKSPGLAIGIAAVAGFLVSRLFKGGSSND